MSHMLAILDEMRQHRSVAIYVGKASLLKLADFLHGYEYALHKTGIESSPLLADFRDWIHQRFGTTKEGWEQLIVTHSGNEADAIGEFWRLLDEFLATHTGYLAEADTARMKPSVISASTIEMSRKWA